MGQRGSLKGNFKKYIGLNENENTTNQICGKHYKQSWEKFIALNAYIKRRMVSKFLLQEITSKRTKQQKKGSSRDKSKNQYNWKQKKIEKNQ